MIFPAINLHVVRGQCFLTRERNPPRRGLRCISQIVLEATKDAWIDPFQLKGGPYLPVISMDFGIFMDFQGESINQLLVDQTTNGKNPCLQIEYTYL